MRTARIYLVDDDPFQIMLLSGILRSAGHEVQAFEDPGLLLAHLTPMHRGCAVLDLQMPGLSGLDLQRALGQRGVRLPLIFVSGQASIPAAVAAMKEGALDFLSKPVDPTALCDAAARALARDHAAAVARNARADAQQRWAALSTREQDACRLFAQGLLNKQIAAELRVTDSTAQAHRARALQKLKVRTATEAAQLLAQVGER